MEWYNDYMPYGSSESSTCLSCGETFPHLKKLSEHIKKNHGISPRDYYITYFCNNVRPSCPICGEPPRYVSLRDGFKVYCKDHATSAMSIGGLAGGKAPAWNKGKTKETDDRLLLQSVKMTGDGNPFFGKRHSK